LNLTKLGPKGLRQSLHEELVEGELFFHNHQAILLLFVQDLAGFVGADWLPLREHVLMGTSSEL
jgi:hypothetical protein